MKSFLRDCTVKYIKRIENFLVKLINQLKLERVPVDDSAIGPKHIDHLLTAFRFDIYAEQFIKSIKKSELGALVDVLTVQKGLKSYYAEVEKQTEEEARRAKTSFSLERAERIKKFIVEKIKNQSEYDYMLELVAACYLRIPNIEALEFQREITEN